MIFFLLLFLLSVFLVFYSYVLFPFILSVYSSGKSFRHLQYSTPEELPYISVVMSAYNEERVIGDKLKGILNSVYPREKIEILVGSDSSVDNTPEIIRRFAAEDSRIRFFEFRERRGKPSVINELVGKAVHPIVVLTDANVMFEAATLDRLCRHFKSPEIGLTGANILNIGIKKDGISIQEKSYIERENKIKYQEGLVWGTMMGPFGGCYAIRKELYFAVPSNFLVDDFYISMKILEKGFKCINELEAICYEDVSNEALQEYRRKARISAGNFQNLKEFSGMLLKPFTAAGFCFISHKVLRWITPLFILTSLLSLGMLVLITQLPVWIFLFTGEVLLIISPLIDKLLRSAKIHLKLLRFISYFSLMNLALLKGFIHYMSGIKTSIWTPTSRNL